MIRAGMASSGSSERVLKAKTFCLSQKDCESSEDPAFVNMVWSWKSFLPRSIVYWPEGMKDASLASTFITGRSQDCTGAVRWKSSAEVPRFKRSFISENIGSHLCVSGKSRPNKHSASNGSRTEKVRRKIIDATFISTASSHFTLFAPWLAARSRWEHGFRDDCIFGGRRTKTLGIKEETLTPVSQTASNGISQTVLKHLCHPSVNLDISSVGGFLSSLHSCLVDTQVLAV